MKNFGATCIALLSVMGLEKAYAADCHIHPYSFVFGQDITAHMAVKSGRSCGSNIRVGGGGLRSLAITQQAQNGQAMTPTAVRWEYRSKPGYSGKDAFVVQASGESMSSKRGMTHSGNVNISVDVDVIP